MSARRTWLPALALVGSWGLLAAAPNPGVVFEIETTYHDDRPRVESSEMSVEGEMLKMEILPDDDSDRSEEVIYRGDRKEMIVVDHGERSYMVFDEEALTGAAASLRELEAEMGSMRLPGNVLDAIPEDRRRMIEDAMRGGGAAASGRAAGGMSAPGAPRGQREIRRTGERATRAGYPAIRYDVFVDGVRTEEIWVTDWDNVEGGDEAGGAFESLQGFYTELMDSFGDILGGAGGSGGLFGDRSDPLTGFTELDGFPVVTRTFENGELESETTLKSARRRTLDPADFEPPAGYRRREMMPPR